MLQHMKKCTNHMYIDVKTERRGYIVPTMNNAIHKVCKCTKRSPNDVHTHMRTHTHTGRLMLPYKVVLS